MSEIILRDEINVLKEQNFMLKQSLREMERRMDAMERLMETYKTKFEKMEIIQDELDGLKHKFNSFILTLQSPNSSPTSSPTSSPGRLDSQARH